MTDLIPIPAALLLRPSVERCTLTGAMLCRLPWPPSVNHYYRHVGAKVLISRDGRAYRGIVLAAAFGCETLTGRLAVTIEASPPDKRRRDIDNLQKCLLDSLQHGGVFVDDSQIDDLRIVRRPAVEGGAVMVRIVEVK